MKIVRTTNAPVVPSEFATQRQHHFHSIHAKIELPFDGLVEMIDRLLLRVQAGLRPRVSWGASRQLGPAQHHHAVVPAGHSAGAGGVRWLGHRIQRLAVPTLRVRVRW